MTVITSAAPPEQEGLAPVVEDMSAFIIAGAVSADPNRYQRETEGRTPAQGLQDGVDAERLGFRRVWLSERWDIKQADVILSGVAARTNRLEVCTGVIAPMSRRIWSVASLAATMQACYGERVVLGLGRGDSLGMKGLGLKAATFPTLLDYVDICRRLWRGETVSYNGPAGHLPQFAFAERYPGNPPQVWFAGFANDMAAEAIAKAFDGVMLPPTVTPEFVTSAKQRIAAACERFDRDPAEIRIAVPVVTAPDLDEVETMSVSAGRIVTYLEHKYYGDALARANNWDPKIVERLRNHEQFQRLHKPADFTFHRHELLGPAALLPPEWIQDTCAIGTVDDVVDNLQRFIDAGADEIATYGSTPRQNARMIAAWRERELA
jgi:5,10-methylenetetrahydromethanopterin reductase